MAAWVKFPIAYKSEYEYIKTKMRGYLRLISFHVGWCSVASRCFEAIIAELQLSYIRGAELGNLATGFWS